jgi:hypothetical protein
MKKLLAWLRDLFAEDPYDAGRRYAVQLLDSGTPPMVIGYTAQAMDANQRRFAEGMRDVLRELKDPNTPWRLL